MDNAQTQTVPARQLPTMNRDYCPPRPSDHHIKEMIRLHLLEFEREFGRQMRDDISRATQTINTSVTNSLNPAVVASNNNTSAIGEIKTEIRVLKTRIMVLSTVGLPVGAFLGFLAGHFI